MQEANELLMLEASPQQETRVEISIALPVVVADVDVVRISELEQRVQAALDEVKRLESEKQLLVQQQQQQQNEEGLNDSPETSTSSTDRFRIYELELVVQEKVP